MIPRLVGIGTHVPPRRVSNLDRMHDLGLDEAFVVDKLGVRQHARKEDGEGTVDLCVKAVADLAVRQALPLAHIDLLCVVTQNPDRRIPHAAATLHDRLGLARHCMTFDISQGCAGFTHGLDIVTAVMRQRGLQHALLLTCDPYSTIVDPADRNTALLFGDAATASYLCDEGPGWTLRDTDAGTRPGTSACLQCDDHLRMDGRAVLMNAAHEVPASVERLLRRQGLALADIDTFLFHPGSLRILELLRSTLDVDAARAPFDILDYGNTVSSSIPLMLSTRFAARPGVKRVLSGFGVGFSWATSLIESI